MGTFEGILGVAGAIGGIILIFSKRKNTWQWRLAAFVDIAVVIVSLYSLFLAEEPATQSDINNHQADIHAKIDSLGSSFICSMDSLKTFIIENSGQQKPDSTSQAKIRSQAECLEGIVKTGLDSGIVAIGLEKYDKAMTSLGFALQATDESLKRAEVFFYIGVIYHFQEEYQLALNSFDSALVYKSDFPEAWSNRGIALYELSHYKEAIASYDSTLVYKPDDYIT